MKLRIYLRRIIPLPRIVELNWNLAAVEFVYQKDIQAAHK